MLWHKWKLLHVFTLNIDSDIKTMPHSLVISAWVFREGWVCKATHTDSVPQVSLPAWRGVSSSLDLGWPSEVTDTLPSGSSVSTEPGQEMCQEAQLRNSKNPFWPPPTYCFSHETAAPTAWVLCRWELGAKGACYKLKPQSATSLR